MGGMRDSGKFGGAMNKDVVSREMFQFFFIGKVMTDSDNPRKPPTEAPEWVSRRF